MKVIVMTGATSGIGAVAINRFAQQPDTLIIVGARGNGRTVPHGTEIFPLDLSSLESTRNFANKVIQRIGNNQIDLLVLNAGTQFGNNKQLSPEGFELTFATNHLSHYLLARLLWPNMAKGSRLVITTSDTHDPAIIPIAPKTMIPEELAHPTDHSFRIRMKTYPSSKLCNLLTARSFETISNHERKDVSVIAFNPGATAGTNLGGKRSTVTNVLFTVLIRPIFFIVSLFKPAFFMASMKRSGEALAKLALGEIKLPKGRIYASHVRHKITFPDPSQLAQSDEARDLLWRESAKMVGLPE